MVVITLPTSIAAVSSGILLPPLLLVLFFVSQHFNKRRISVPILLQDRFPRRKDRAAHYVHHSKEMLLEGYKQYPDTIFGLTTNDGLKLVMPQRYLEEMKSNPRLSFKASVDNDMQMYYTRFGGPPEHFINTIRGGLTPLLPAYTPISQRTMRKHMNTLYGDSEEWYSHNVHDATMQMVGITAARIFHSQEASENPEWLELTMGYLIAVVEGIRYLKGWPPLLRTPAWHFAPQRKKISEVWTSGRRFVQSSMERRKGTGENLESPPSMLDLLSDGKNSAYKDDVEAQTLYQMTLVAVGTFTTFCSTTQCLYDLAAHPDLLQILREEGESVEVDDNGMLGKNSLSQLKKLDSFIKESQRLSSPDLTTFQRAATADVTLSDGTYIPKGTKLEIPTCSIHVDPNYYENGTSFDGLRFWRLREAEGQENKHMYVSVGQADLSFGFGRHACPGRYLSNMMIKVIMHEFIKNYEIKLHPGQARPASHIVESLVDPDPEAKLLLRKRH